MTLIARVEIDGYSFFLGDLLLSSRREFKRDVGIPSSDTVNNYIPESEQYVVSGLSQKLCIVEDKLIVAWAGSSLHARSIVRSLDYAMKRGVASLDDINQALSEFSQTDLDEVSIIGSLLVQNIGEPGSHTAYHFKGGDHAEWKGGGVRVVATGTGADSLIDLMPSVVEELKSLEFDSDNPRLREYALSVFLSAFMIGNEFITGSNILSWWGGGIETALFDTNKYTKPPDIIYTIWKAKIEVDGSIELVLTPKFVKYSYFKDNLVILTVELVNDGTKEDVHRRVDICTPLLGSWTNECRSQFQLPTLDCDRIASYVHVENEQGRLGRMCFFSFSDDINNSPVKFDETKEGVLQLHLNKKIMSNYIEHVRDRFFRNTD